MRIVYVAVLSIALALAMVTVGNSFFADNLAIGCELKTNDFGVDWVNDASARPWTAASPLVTTPRPSLDGKKLSLRFGNLYPGATISWGGWGFNGGDMQAKFSGVKITVTGDRTGMEIADHLFVVPERTFFSWDRDGAGSSRPSAPYYPVPSGYTDLKLARLGDAINGVPVKGYRDLKSLRSFVLDPASRQNDWRRAGRFALGDVSDPSDRRGITLLFDPKAPNSTQGGSMEFTMEFAFTQAIGGGDDDRGDDGGGGDGGRG